MKVTVMATLESKCPLCRAAFQAEQEWIGQVGECPSCGKEIKIQAPQANSNQEQSKIQKEETAKTETLADETKQCPFCSEIIKKKAVKCKYCESYLDGRKVGSTTEPLPEKNIPEKMEPERAGWGERFLAYLIDFIIFIPISLFILSGFAMFKVYLPSDASLPITILISQIGQIFLGILFIFAYRMLLHASTLQGTIGKSLLKLKVLDNNGGRISLLQSFKRSLVEFIPFALSYVLFFSIQILLTGSLTAQVVPMVIQYGGLIIIYSGIALRNDKIGLHDIFANTHVMKHKSARVSAKSQTGTVAGIPINKTTLIILGTIMSLILIGIFLFFYIRLDEANKAVQMKEKHRNELIAQKENIKKQIHNVLNAIDMPDAWQNNLIGDGSWHSSDEEQGAYALLMKHSSLFHKYVELKEALSKTNDELSK